MLKQLAWPQGKANYVTLLRIALAVPLFYFILNGNLVGTILVFAVAALTDGIDGWVARRNGIISDLGKVLDPIADKILIASAFISRIVFLDFWLWRIFIPVLLVELALVTLGIAGFCYREKIGQKLGSNWFGKLKFGSQCLIAFFLLVFPAFWYQGWNWLTQTIVSLTIVAVLLGGLSILGHVRNQKELIRKVFSRK
ncbi:CDP-alcohol phosphatidyltransferase family protein [Patescibacteria group bacterium]|nr:CDP-alcohol phosphatidyltransferase family protein [Patescibacteria group bacterium]